MAKLAPPDAKALSQLSDEGLKEARKEWENKAKHPGFGSFRENLWLTTKATLLAFIPAIATVLVTSREYAKQTTLRVDEASSRKIDTIERVGVTATFGILVISAGVMLRNLRKRIRTTAEEAITVLDTEIKAREARLSSMPTPTVTAEELQELRSREQQREAPGTVAAKHLQSKEAAPAGLHL